MAPSLPHQTFSVTNAQPKSFAQAQVCSYSAFATPCPRQVSSTHRSSMLGTKPELVTLFPNKDCIIATILFYENEINELPIMFKHKTNKDELDNLKVVISENTHEFDWSKHFDKFQLKLRELILSKIPK